MTANDLDHVIDHAQKSADANIGFCRADLMAVLVATVGVGFVLLLIGVAL